jgi:hypothetical protein
MVWLMVWQIVATLLFFIVGALAAEGRRIYVDPLVGSDTNSGVAAQPLRSVAAAVNIATDNRRLGIPTTVTLRPGVYRESIHLVGQGPVDAPAIVVQADKIGAAIITGSDRWDDWQQDPSSRGRYSHIWPYKWGTCSVPTGWPGIQPLGLRREMIFVNGELLAAAAQWASNPWTSEDDCSPHARAPVNIEEVGNWTTSAVRYISQQFGAAIDRAG